MAQILDVPVFASISAAIPDGNVIYAEDTQRHYMVVGGIAYLIPNSTEMLKEYTASGIQSGGFPILRKASTNSSGVATIYLTDTNLSSGAALFATVFEDGIVAMPVGANNYQVTGVVLSGDKKSIAVSLNQISSVLGILTLSSTAGSGVEVRAAIWGK